MELFYEGAWGRVIAGRSSDALARVACRQAGYPYTEGTGFFEQGSGPVWVDIWHCAGDEERVEQCQHGSWRNRACSSCSDVSVRCRGECVWCDKDTHTVSRCLIYN